MGNPTIYYDRQSIDLGASGVSNVQGGRVFEGSRVFAGAAQTTVLRSYHALQIQKRFTDRTLFRALQEFWNDWALRGLPFAFAVDSAKIMDAPITVDPVYGNLIDNGDMEVWTSSTASTEWSLSISGGTTIDREGAREHVYDGIYSMRWNLSGASQSSASINSNRQLPISVPFTLSFWQKDSAGFGMNYAVKNATAGLWASDTAGNWTTALTWLTTSTPNTIEWSLFTQAFAAGLNTTTGTITVALRNLTSGSAPHWVDDLRLIRTTGVLRVRSVDGLAASDVVRLISRTEPREEFVTVSSYSAVSLGIQDLTLSALPRGRFDVRDIVRHEDYYPFLVADQKDPALTENPGAVFDLNLKCREALTGRD